MVGMLDDDRSADELVVEIDETALLAIMRDILADYETVSDYADIIDVKIESGSIELYLRVNVGNILSVDIANMINCNYLYVVVNVDINIIKRLSRSTASRRVILTSTT